MRRLDRGSKEGTVCVSISEIPTQARKRQGFMNTFAALRGRGTQGVGAFRWESSHQEHPFIALTSPNISQTCGEVYGMHFVYSGNFQA